MKTKTIDHTATSELRTSTKHVDTKNVSPELSLEQMHADAERCAADFIHDVDRNLTALQSRADKIGASLDSADTTELESLKQEVVVAKETLLQKLFGRARKALKIPEPIDRAFEEASRAGDLTAVDTFNDDPDVAPPIIRRPNKLSKTLLAVTTLTTIGLTHEPQVEAGAKAAATEIKKLKHRAEKSAEHAIETVKDAATSASDWIVQNRPFGREAYAEEIPNGKQDETNSEQKGEGIDVTSIRRVETMKTIAELRKGLPKLSDESLEIAVNLIEEAETRYEIDYEKFFLGMELIAGHITKDQYDDAMQKFYDILNEVSSKLSDTEKNSPIRVAFELAKQRKTYVDNQADVSAMLLKGEGNCEALVRFLLAEVPRVTTSHVEMAVQVYTDHVRFLVRANDKDPWEWVDGHTHGVLTLEEMKGTLIVSPKDMVQLSLKQKQTQPKGEIPKEEQIDIQTNTTLQWTTLDGRVPKKASSHEPIPKFVDESKDAETKFEDGIKKEKIEHMQLIEVNADLFPGAVEQPNDSTPDQAKSVPKLRVAPDEKFVSQFLTSGYINGNFNDLSPLKGINVDRIDILHPNHYGRNPNAANDIDLSVLSGSDLKEIVIDKNLIIRNTESINAKHIQTVEVGILGGISFINRVVTESTDFKTAKLNIFALNTNDAYIQMMTEAPKDPDIGRITKILAEKKSGIIDVVVDSPFESQTSVTWRFKGETGEWQFVGGGTIAEGDYLHRDIRTSLDQLKTDPTSLDLPDSNAHLEYLNVEKIDFTKLKEVVLHGPATHFEQARRDGPDNDQDVIDFDTTVLAQATNLETIIIKMSLSQNTLDLSAFASLNFKRIIIQTDSELQSVPIRGIPKSKVSFTHIETVN